MIKTYSERLWPYFVQLSYIQNTRLKARYETAVYCAHHTASVASGWQRLLTGHRFQHHPVRSTRGSGPQHCSPEPTRIHT